MATEIRLSAAGFCSDCSIPAAFLPERFAGASAQPAYQKGKEKENKTSRRDFLVTRHADGGVCAVGGSGGALLCGVWRVFLMKRSMDVPTGSAVSCC